MSNNKKDKDIDLNKLYLKKSKLLKKFNKEYYNQDNPSVSDKKYDLLKKEILELEKSNVALKKFQSVSNIVGAPLSNKFKKIKHLKPMLSLSNAFDKDDMQDF